jgi:hypothetical protein
MNTDLIPAINELTKNGRKARKVIYEELLSKGEVKPGSQAIVDDVITYGIENGLISSNKIKVCHKMRG